MKFQLVSEKVQEVYKKIEKLLNARSVIPILSGVLVQVRQDCIVFTASDGTESVIHRVLSSEEDGVVVISEGKAVFTKEALAVSKKIKGLMTFETTENNVVVSQDKTKLEFPVLDGEEFPKIEFEPTLTPIVFTGKEFLDIVHQTIFAVSQSETRPILTGVNFQFGKDGNTFVATDSHRLAQIELGAAPIDVTLTVPAKTLDNAVKTFDFSNDVMVLATPNKIAFGNGNTMLSTRLLEGNYPDTSRLIPKADFETELTVNKKEFFEALDLLTEISKQKTNVVQISINGLFVEFSATNGTSKGKKEIAFTNLEGNDNFSLSFSGEFVKNALKAIDSEEVKLSFAGPMKPFLIRPADTEESSIVQLILPVRNN
ncbi:DNA polymerase III subunit beta [Bacillus cihuensis]|uniref:DNA polymerase III subunit beta n=1 Tax=Bacillus cihuensis TaxID=1208599 RepID=UPI00041C58C0|nr:DNA polymerase III subunit beta [Bacillus cihuensis]